MASTDNTSPTAGSAVADAAPAAAVAAPRSKRKAALLGVAGLVGVAAIAYGIYYALVLNHFESTDNAYVQGNVVQVTPQIAGTVVAINADDTDFVKAGQSLVKLDPADAQVALEQAEAQLAQAVREVRTLYANNGALKAQIAAREADLVRARSDVARAQDDVARRAPLVQSGAVGREEFNHVNSQLTLAKAGVTAAESATSAAREQLTSNQSLTEGVAVEQHPTVLR
ncbi:MAG: biotin/lipoyl-binding protein, partial [Pseudomonadota bacterium]|nr:biotin/lipoyl-binding protein [Pseudomonadota bacterium]